MRRSMLLGVIAAMAASCTVQEADVLMDERTEPVFYASFEQPEEDTKVYANEQLLIRWHEDDRLSIFNKLTYNQQYQFTGKTGDNSGSFKKVDEDVFVTGNTINDIVAVYPYQQGTSIAEDEILSVELPGEQVFAQNSFGRGANTMVSVSSGNVLMFKNVGAYLMFSLYGEDVSVSSITLRGNNGEKLSGKAYVTMPLNGLPSAEVVGDATDASTAITLRCETPMALGASAAECTEFWFVVPPVTFSRGFTITITQSNGGTVEKSTSNTITLTRNKLSRMAPMEVEKAVSPEHEMVDLGLSVMWATCNVGATSPEEYGDYFAWGETEPYYEAGYAQSESPVWKSGKESGYYWPSYKWCNGAQEKLTKYCTNSDYWDGTGPMDNKTVLDLEDDAAHVNWGGSWRMPTRTDWQELFDNCTWTWTTQNGVTGRKVTGPNGKSIFLPAAGVWNGTNLDGAGSHGNYWFSSLNTDGPNRAYYVLFDSDYYYWYSSYRYLGFSVRPVSGEPARPEPVRFTVAFDELSGLCLSADGDFLWAIGDNGDLAKLSIEGEVLWKSHIRGDSEAITLDPSTGDLLIGMEPNVVGVVKGPDFNGGASTLFSLSKAISYGNSGVEGITYYKDGLVYVGTQTESRLFCCELATGEVLWDKSLYNDGLVSEIAGMCYDPIADRLWIIDSEKKTLFVYTGDAETLLGSYPVAGSNPESVCVDHAHDCVWVGDDYGSISYLYRYPISELGALAQ